MSATTYREIRDSLIQLYLEDHRPWLVGFSGGKDSTMLAFLLFDDLLNILKDDIYSSAAEEATPARH